MEWTCFNPTQIIMRSGAVKEYAFRTLGRHALLVCGRTSARICGALDDVREALILQGVDYTVFDRVENNPSVETCFAAGALAREVGADFVIGVGGGSPLDAAKAIAAFAAHEYADAESIYRDGVSSALPVVAVGTTAGTGSEVTQYAVLTVASASTKMTVKSPLLFPKAALMDPKYTATLPLRLTVSCAVDALSHCIEGYFSVRASAYTDAVALRALRMLGNNLGKLRSGELSDTVRGELLQASTMAGQVIAQTGTGFAHVLGYMLTFFEGFQHGEANAQFLADFVASMGSARPDKANTTLRALGLSSTEELRAYLRELIPNTPHLTRAQVERFTAISARSKSLANAVTVIGAKEIEELFGQYAD
ncbi:MAG: iron-containing alcohol dehydrogenase [Oscillospiraceae bacterium]|nr:iron-containing alcohol dehydrogenase [Oscillospiraceae bacterium]